MKFNKNKTEKPKKEKIKKIKKEKPKKEKIEFKKASFSIKSNRIFYIIAIVYSILLFVVAYMIFGLLISAFVFIPFSIFLFLSMIMDRHVRKSGVRKLVKTIMIFIMSLGILGVMGFAAFFMYIASTAPKFDTEKLNFVEPSIVYDNQNKEIASLGLENREKIAYEEISQVLIDAIIATEDSRFFQHNGLDAPRFAKAVLGQLAGQNAGGGSTLTMQVAKNAYTSTTSSGIEGIIRKFTDIYLSIFKIEKNYTKEEIIEFYVNIPFLGSRAYGVEQASKTYFGKSASELNLAEASLIAGLFQAPGSYDPNVNPKLATERRATVLSLMKRHGYITEEQEKLANAIPVESLLVEYQTTMSPYQGYIDLVINEVIEKTGMDPYQVPMLIYTNMDTKKQEAINDLYNGVSYKWRNNTVQSGLVAMEVKTGKVLVVGAGRNRTKERGYSYATDIKRQIGSTAKPIFDYAPGIEFNNWSTGQFFEDEKYKYSDGKTIKNWDGKYKGEMTLRQALQQSRNIPALKAFQQVDNKKIVEFITSIGLKPEISGGYIHEAHAIGGFNGSNPLEMAAAYAVLSNGGYYYEPYTVNKIVFRDDKAETITYSSTGKKVLSEATAYMITDVLNKGVNNGAINVSRISGVHLAAKTGTTDFSDKTRKEFKLPSSAINDGWVVGYSPTISMALWYGYDTLEKGVYITMNQNNTDRKKIYNVAGKAVFDKTNAWKKPSGVVSVEIEHGSDPVMLPSEYTPEKKKVTELFKKGTEPTDVSNRYVPLPDPTNVNVTYVTGSASISWDAVVPHENIDLERFGEFGYDVYYNGTHLGFTTLTTYHYDVEYPYGVYTVKAAYKTIKDNRSAIGGTFAMMKDAASVNLSISLTSPDPETIALGKSYSEPAKPLTAYDNLIDITNSAQITKTIYDENNNAIGSSIADLNTYNNTPGTYKIVYTVTYSGVTKTKEKTIIFQ